MQGWRKVLMWGHKIVERNNYKSSKDGEGEVMEVMLSGCLSPLMRQKVNGGYFWQDNFNPYMISSNCTIKSVANPTMSNISYLE
jgi:hypothetical protein